MYTPPGLGDCVHAMSDDGSMSAQQAKAVCGSSHASFKSDLDYCAETIVLNQGFSQKRASDTCDGKTYEHSGG